MSSKSRGEKVNKRKQKRELREEFQRAEPAANEPHYDDPKRKIKIQALTGAQGHYLVSLEKNQLTFGVGPAGTGKTYVCTAWGAKQLMDRRIDRLIVTRPAVEAGRGLGFLPGTLQEKFEPYFAPFRNVLAQLLGNGHLEYLIKREQIVIAPLEFIRGLTFDNCVVILDEAQNTTPEQMKLFLTRLGENSVTIVNGDISQKDITGLSGMEDAMKRLEGLKQVGICEFTEDDIVRSGLVKDILMRYRKSN